MLWCDVEWLVIENNEGNGESSEVNRVQCEIYVFNIRWLWNSSKVDDFGAEIFELNRSVEEAVRR